MYILVSRELVWRAETDMPTLSPGNSYFTDASKIGRSLNPPEISQDPTVQLTIVQMVPLVALFREKKGLKPNLGSSIERIPLPTPNECRYCGNKVLQSASGKWSCNLCTGTEAGPPATRPRFDAFLERSGDANRDGQARGTTSTPSFRSLVMTD